MSLAPHSPQIPTLHVSMIELPREFERLYDLAYNLWWAWTPQARELFSSIDSAKWGRYHNPVELLINVDPKRWYRLVENEAFHTAYQQVTGELDDYLRGAGTWFEERHGAARDERIGYFSMEYGLHQSLAIYSGGLGVLSGDHCKAASDLGLPFVAVGLLYRHGYFQQNLDHEGMQQHIYPEYDFTRLPLRPIASATGREVFVSLRLPGRDVKIKLWLAQIGRVPLILLDTDVPENHPCDRPITNLLYVGGREMRLLQEMVLGIGGVRALRAIGIEPTVWHLNEGHSVFLQLERLRELVAAEALSPHEARDRLQRNAVFTTHTPVPAGNEQFDDALIDKYFAGWCDEVGLGMDQLLAWGRRRDDGGEANFNLTALAIRTASWVNGVSRLNAEVASDMWRHLFAGDDQPIHAITNGVHARTWLGPEMQNFLRHTLSSDWERLLLEPDAWTPLHDVSDAELWTRHRAQKERLGRFLRSRLRDQFARHGASPDDLRAIDAIFDPETLTIGFARRFATYKRAKLVFSDLDRLDAILNHAERPVQMVFAGKAHPADRPGQALIQYIFELSRNRFAGQVIFLENYDMRMGRMLVQGVDVWLNTPRRPLEASGTSGQKVAMNGGLNFSILDGWWPEGWNGQNGWVIGGEGTYDDRGKQDWEDAQSLYATLGEQIVPLYYDRGDDGLPHGWISRMKEAMATLTARFSASRMVRDYLEQGYLPAAKRRL